MQVRIIFLKGKLLCNSISYSKTQIGPAPPIGGRDFANSRTLSLLSTRELLRHSLPVEAIPGREGKLFFSSSPSPSVSYSLLLSPFKALLCSLSLSPLTCGFARHILSHQGRDRAGLPSIPSMASQQTFEWHPARLLQEQDNAANFALLVLNQPLKNSVILRRLWKNCTHSSSSLLHPLNAD